MVRPTIEPSDRLSSSFRSASARVWLHVEPRRGLYGSSRFLPCGSGLPVESGHRPERPTRTPRSVHISENPMASTPKCIDALQVAGQAIFNAREVLLAEANQIGAQVAAAMAANPFGVENDELIEKWKLLSRIGHELAVIELQVRGLFERAGGAVPLSLPPTAKTLFLGDGLDVAANVSDVKPKSAKRRQKVVAKEHASRLGRKPRNPQVLREFLLTVLRKEHPTRLTMTQMSKGSGVASGSMHPAVKTLLESGFMMCDSEGRYLLV